LDRAIFEQKRLAVGIDMDTRFYRKQLCMRLVYVFLVVLFAVTGVSAQESTSEPLETLTVDNLERQYSVYVPENLTEPAPLVVALHPRGATGEAMRQISGFDAVADIEGFIVAYPDAIAGEWNYTRGIPGYDVPHDDVKFLDTLVETLAETYNIDRERVYLVGFSNGGFMAERAACEVPTHFAAYATVAAAGFGGMLDVCVPKGTASAPILMMHGSADDNIPWDGMGVTRGDQTVYVLYPVTDTLAYWADFNDCEVSADRQDLPQSGRSPGTAVRILTVPCANDSAVVLYVIVGGGHNWPGYEVSDGRAGLVNMDIDAATEIWKFFQQHPPIPE
jgi:polyhydroxybutyrate depolymerase